MRALSLSIGTIHFVGIGGAGMIDLPNVEDLTPEEMREAEKYVNNGDEEGALAFPTTGSGFAFMAPNTTQGMMSLGLRSHETVCSQTKWPVILIDQ